MSKENPHARKYNALDMKKEFQRGQDRGIRFGLTVALWVLANFLHRQQSELEAFKRCFEQTIDELLHTKISFALLLKTLKDEYDIEMEFK